MPVPTAGPLAEAIAARRGNGKCLWSQPFRPSKSAASLGLFDHPLVDFRDLPWKGTTAWLVHEERAHKQPLLARHRTLRRVRRPLDPGQIVMAIRDHLMLLHDRSSPVTFTNPVFVFDHAAAGERPGGTSATSGRSAQRYVRYAKLEDHSRYRAHLLERSCWDANYIAHVEDVCGEGSWRVSVTGTVPVAGYFSGDDPIALVFST